ncbi:hypothetical protein GUITHDRAFT_147025 [Guillardia theta CCMP2712]|uniref:Protein kinase domain-containing protein n=1 Tax=Guillardia theta (strain CCMP2712) TaxID=905079 RepID=L1IF49_GUITC|nr:hypothetical protein GUITHDRAFT_147025 [Guillardia theta CCMP2712]EKX34707.1 hypothetical protein GUITHDRAFT_147025 [Guillardia theta CCMP2712]|eukprot:XP_005821687.1 hypothetical protein GUITHDRAFT_147025 [Guillardia theta CCMP2712]
MRELAGRSWSAGGDAMQITKLVQGIEDGSLSDLTHLDLSNCKMNELPAQVCSLPSLELLNLGGNNLSSLPDDIGGLVSLKILFFLGNKFERIPPAIKGLHNLETLSFKGNRLVEVGEDRLPLSLKALILTNNKIAELPRSIGRLQKLQKIMLAQNELMSLPDELADCNNLELIRLANNRLEAIPERLFLLPRLSWIGLAGNEHLTRAPHNIAKTYSMEDLEMFEQIGRGASGCVHRALLRPTGTPVAVKIFHEEEAISDGSPWDEIAIASSSLIGIVKEPKLAAITHLAPQGSKILAKPPSLASITRDVYTRSSATTGEHNDTIVGPLSLSAVIAIAYAMANGLRALHDAGICHGDLYAHNILVEPSSLWACLLDFGASFCFHRDAMKAPLPVPLLLRLEVLTVLAYGRLLEELLGMTDGVADARDLDAMESLQQLAEGRTGGM